MVLLGEEQFDRFRLGENDVAEALALLRAWLADYVRVSHLSELAEIFIHAFAGGVWAQVADEELALSFVLNLLV